MKITGVILSGGRSSRMKFNKAFAELNGQKLIEIIIKKFTETFDETIIISNEPKLYEIFNLPIYTDVIAHKGPVSGIHSALLNAKNDTIFTSACDMPFFNMDIVNYMFKKKDNYDAVVPIIGGLHQPLATLYTKNCTTIFEENLKNDRLKIKNILNEMNTLYLDQEEFDHYGNLDEIFFNVNDQEALKTARSIAGRLLK